MLALGIALGLLVIAGAMLSARRAGLEVKGE